MEWWCACVCGVYKEIEPACMQYSKHSQHHIIGTHSYVYTHLFFRSGFLAGEGNPCDFFSQNHKHRCYPPQDLPGVGGW